jgi:hypothetical protein
MFVLKNDFWNKVIKKQGLKNDTPHQLSDAFTCYCNPAPIRNIQAEICTRDTFQVRRQRGESPHDDSRGEALHAASMQPCENISHVVLDKCQSLVESQMEVLCKA